MSNKYVPHIVTSNHESIPSTHPMTNPNVPNPPSKGVHPTTRSRSTSQIIPANNNNPAPQSNESKESKYKRPYSYSVSSVNSNTSDLDLDDAYVNKNKKMMNDIDLENQLILTAGGNREDVFCFFFKLLVLMLLVLGSGVLVFYAL